MPGLPRSSSLGTLVGLLASAIGLSRLFASTFFGIAWTFLGIQAALTIFLACLVVMLLVAAVLLGGSRAQPIHG